MPWRARGSNHSTDGFRCQEILRPGYVSLRATSRFRFPTESRGRMWVSPAGLRAALRLLLHRLRGASFVRARETLCLLTSVQCRVRHGLSVERRLPVRDLGFAD